MKQVSRQCTENVGVRCELKVKALSKSVLLKFLRKVDNDFVPSLSQKTDLEAFCTKIMSKAMLFVSCAKDGNINGLVVMYANDLEHHYSYVSLVAVDLSFRKQGIADSLMRKAISYVKSLGKDKINCIGIHTNNAIALHLYEKLGFVVQSELDNRKYLEMKF